MTDGNCDMTLREAATEIADPREGRITMSNEHCVPIVIEDQGSDEVEWGVSFNGIYPKEKDYVSMKDGETAFKLVDLIQLYFPQSRSMNQAVDQVTNDATEEPS